ncbi:MAG: winged helix-turn-helix domain-containing protein [Pyrinomonadaceae bacterium]|nr:winged helix-turn-helix domain-containing protein [Pyrinomonadaceae bacterium]
MDIGLKRFYEFDSFRVDVAERQLWQAGNPVFLTPKVFDMLLVLLENKGETVEKDELIKKVWADTYVEEGSLNRNISTLRKALGDNSTEQKFIKTLPKRGYRFTAQVAEIVERIPSVTKKNDDQIFSVQPQVSTPKKSIFPLRYTKIFLSIIVFAGLMAILAWMIFQSPKNKIDLSGLTENERQQLNRNSSSNPQAVENYVKGRSLWHQRSAEGLHQSIIHLESAVKADGNFALAHSALADAYAFDTTKRTLANQHADEAIRLDPTLGEPYATLGFMQMFWDWDLSKADEYFQNAVQLSPNYATAHQWYSLNLVTRRRGGAALAEMKRALELEPKSLAINADLCQIYYFLQKYDEALVQCNKTLEMDANFLNAHLYLYDIYFAKGLYAEAVEKFFKIEQIKSDFTFPPAHLEKLRESYSKGGIREFWKTMAEYLQQTQSFYGSAKYYARLGEKEKALNSLENSFKQPPFEIVFFLTEPIFREIQEESKFKELAVKFESNK